MKVHSVSPIISYRVHMYSDTEIAQAWLKYSRHTDMRPYLAGMYRRLDRQVAYSVCPWLQTYQITVITESQMPIYRPLVENIAVIKTPFTTLSYDAKWECISHQRLRTHTHEWGSLAFLNYIHSYGRIIILKRTLLCNNIVAHDVIWKPPS